MLTRLREGIAALTAHAGFRRYFANTSWLFAEQLLRMAAGLLVGVWVARYLGPGPFGIFSYATAFVAIFAGLAKLGLDTIVVRELVHEPERRDELLGTAFWLKLAGGLLTVAVVAAALRFNSGDRATKLYILIIAAGIVFQAAEVIDFYFQSQVLSRFVSLCKMTQLAVSSLLKLGFILAHAPLLWFVVVILIDQATLALTLHLAYRSRGLGAFHRRFDSALARRLLAASWPLIFSSLFIMIYLRIDQVMIKSLLGEREVGLFSAAVRLSEVWYMVPALLCNSLFPAILRARHAGEAVYNFRLQRLYTLMLWLAIAIALPMTFLSRWLVVRLYGAAYGESGPVLMIHVWTGLFVFVGMVTGNWLISEGLQHHIMRRTLASAAVNVLLNLTLIPRFGIRGAAWATVASLALSAYAFDLVSPRTRIACVMKLKALDFTPLLRWGGPG